MGRSRLLAAARVPVVAVAVLVAVVTLAGCTRSAPNPKPTKSGTASSAPTPTPTADPTFAPDASAKDNKVFFDLTNNKLFAANGSANGRTIIDNLASAGFDKAAMQVTPDKTSINGGVDSILFSVKVGDSCLLGQHGSGGYSSSVEPALVSGGCLVGKTRAIDW
ncbi:hypothetical protein [Glaciihabitans sp. UYNi722]|uniref:DUF6993 domain-containing protein n=1 Tax=Glaciihabitans sp. UYNi722 TaxID=3156344 RepID=UPI00339704D7